MQNYKYKNKNMNMKIKPIKIVDLGIGAHNYYTGYSAFENYNVYDIVIKGEDFKFYVRKNGNTSFFKQTVEVINDEWFGLVQKKYQLPYVLFSLSIDILSLTNTIESVTASVEYMYEEYLEKQAALSKRAEEIKNNIFILK